MSATGTIPQNKRVDMFKPFLDGTDAYDVPTVLVAVMDDDTEYTLNTGSDDLFTYDFTDDKVVLNSEVTASIDIDAAGTIEEIKVQSNVLASGGGRTTLLTIALNDETVTFQGPGTYTITQLDLTIS